MVKSLSFHILAKTRKRLLETNTLLLTICYKRKPTVSTSSLLKTKHTSLIVEKKRAFGSPASYWLGGEVTDANACLT
jgi:hypothetical protein